MAQCHYDDIQYDTLSSFNITSVSEHLTGRYLVCKHASHVTDTPKSTTVRLQ